MQSPHPPCPSSPPRAGVSLAESDTSLTGRLRGRPESESPETVALLLARHWQATYDYSAICLATKGSSASMVATASFHQVLEHLMRRELGGALRLHLLVTVREMVKRWSVDDRISAFMPELRKPTGGRGMRAARSTTPEKRKLAAHAFWALPGVAQCLLWHTEVEAEHISIPAGLSGLSADNATAGLEQAREQFRAGVVRAHRERAPTKECSFYNRLLDVPIRRGGTLLPDVQQHLLECRHCRDAAEQLSHFEGGLGALLAEAILGWGARRYLESRPGRGGSATRRGGAAGQGGRHAGGGGRHRPLSRIAAPGEPYESARRRTRALRAGAALGAAALLAAVLVTTLSSDDDNSGGSPPTWMTGMTGSHEQGPGAGSEAPSVGPSAPFPTDPGRFDQGRLRNAAADLCLDLRGGGAKPGTETKLARCSAKASQQWSYEKNGLLSSVPHPELCLDSHADNGVIALGLCAAPSAARADEVRYDLTVLGELLPRWHEGLAVVPSSLRKGADVVVKVRDGSVNQRWMLDSSTTARGSRSIDGRSGLSVGVSCGMAAPAPVNCGPASPRERKPGPRGEGGAKTDGYRRERGPRLPARRLSKAKVRPAIGLPPQTAGHPSRGRPPRRRCRAPISDRLTHCLPQELLSCSIGLAQPGRTWLPAAGRASQPGAGRGVARVPLSAGWSRAARRFLTGA